MESTPNYDLAFLLLLGSRTVIDYLHKHMAALGYDDVRPAHGFAFQRIAPNGATGNELAEFLGITKQAASEMVDYLEQRGYVVRNFAHSGETAAPDDQIFGDKGSGGSIGRKGLPEGRQKTFARGAC